MPAMNAGDAGHRERGGQRRSRTTPSGSPQLAPSSTDVATQSTPIVTQLSTTTPDPLAQEDGAHRHRGRPDAVEHPQALLLEQAAGDDGHAEEQEQQPDARAHGRGR